SFWLAWKVTTRRAVIGISSPVLGLRPGRCGLSRNWKLPKPDSLTQSPRSSAVRISSKKPSTMSLASRLLRPTCSNKRSASSALVSVMSASRATQAASEHGLGLFDENGNRRLDFSVFECALSILHRYPEGKALLVRVDALAVIDVEQADLAHHRRRNLAQHLEHALDRDIDGDDERKIATHGGHARDLGIGRHARAKRGIQRDLEHDRRSAQIVALHPYRMQFADHTDGV